MSIDTVTDPYIAGTKSTEEGATLTLVIGFPYEDLSEVKVLVKTSAGLPAESPARWIKGFLGNQYSIAAQTVTITDTFATKAIVYRDTALTQLTGFSPEDDFTPQLYEAALDKLTRIAQDQQEQIDRSVKLETPKDDFTPVIKGEVPVGGLMTATADGFEVSTEKETAMDEAVVEATTQAETSKTSAGESETWAEGLDEEVTQLGGTHSSKVWTEVGEGFAYKSETALDKIVAVTGVAPDPQNIHAAHSIVNIADIIGAFAYGDKFSWDWKVGDINQYSRVLSSIKGFPSEVVLGEEDLSLVVKAYIYERWGYTPIPSGQTLSHGVKVTDDYIKDHGKTGADYIKLYGRYDDDGKDREIDDKVKTKVLILPTELIRDSAGTPLIDIKQDSYGFTDGVRVAKELDSGYSDDSNAFEVNKSQDSSGKDVYTLNFDGQSIPKGTIITFEIDIDGAKEYLEKARAEAEKAFTSSEESKSFRDQSADFKALYEKYVAQTKRYSKGLTFPPTVQALAADDGGGFSEHLIPFSNSVSADMRKFLTKENFKGTGDYGYEIKASFAGTALTVGVGDGFQFQLRESSAPDADLWIVGAYTPTQAGSISVTVTFEGAKQYRDELAGPLKALIKQYEDAIGTGDTALSARIATAISLVTQKINEAVADDGAIGEKVVAAQTAASKAMELVQDEVWSFITAESFHGHKETDYKINIEDISPSLVGKLTKSNFDKGIYIFEAKIIERDNTEHELTYEKIFSKNAWTFGLGVVKLSPISIDKTDIWGTDSGKSYINFYSVRDDVYVAPNMRFSLTVKRISDLQVQREALQAQVDTAKDWSTKDDGPVTGSADDGTALYSSKHYSEQSEDNYNKSTTVAKQISQARVGERGFNDHVDLTSDNLKEVDGNANLQYSYVITVLQDDYAFFVASSLAGKDANTYGSDFAIRLPEIAEASTEIKDKDDNSFSPKRYKEFHVYIQKVSGVPQIQIYAEGATTKIGSAKTNSVIIKKQDEWISLRCQYTGKASDPQIWQVQTGGQVDLSAYALNSSVAAAKRFAVSANVRLSGMGAGLGSVKTALDLKADASALDAKADKSSTREWLKSGNVAYAGIVVT